MSNEQNIRDELAATIHENFNACRGRNGVNPYLLADEILASPVIRRIQAEARVAAIDEVEDHLVRRDCFTERTLNLISDLRVM